MGLINTSKRSNELRIRFQLSTWCQPKPRLLDRPLDVGFLKLKFKLKMKPDEHF
jgi:hypothetical protein